MLSTITLLALALAAKAAPTGNAIESMYNLFCFSNFALAFVGFCRVGTFQALGGLSDLCFKYSLKYG